MVSLFSFEEKIKRVLDTYTLYKSDGTTQIAIDETNIAWPSDRDNKFKNPTPYDKTKQWISMEDGNISYEINEVLILTRTFYCLDENRWSSRFQKIMGKNYY